VVNPRGQWGSRSVIRILDLHGASHRESTVGRLYVRYVRDRCRRSVDVVDDTVDGRDCHGRHFAEDVEGDGESISRNYTGRGQIIAIARLVDVLVEFDVDVVGADIVQVCGVDLKLVGVCATSSSLDVQPRVRRHSAHVVLSAVLAVHKLHVVVIEGECLRFGDGVDIKSEIHVGGQRINLVGGGRAVAAVVNERDFQRAFYVPASWVVTVDDAALTFPDFEADGASRELEFM